MRFFWFRDLFRESKFKGSQNLLIQTSLKLGIIFFILREVFFFISFFWTYYHFVSVQSPDLGLVWPPFYQSSIDSNRVPLVNRLILLSRGVTLTLSHHLLLLSHTKYKFYLILTVFLGALFSICQYWEYIVLDFLWSDSSYGRIFFIGTGFHGIHVLIGSIILLTIYLLNNSLINSILFELGAWYWHFVDVVWIILFSEFYYWGI